MIYSKTLTSISDEVFSVDRLKEITREDKKRVVTTILGYVLNIFNYQEFTLLTFLSSSERKNLRLALNKHGREIFLLRLAVFTCLRDSSITSYSMKKVFIGFGLHSSDSTLVEKLSDMRLKTKAKAKARSCLMPLDVKVADKYLSSLMDEINKPLCRAVKKKLQYVYDSQGFSSVDFSSIILERAIMTFYKYYPMYNEKSLRLTMAKSGHNYIENIRVHFNAEERTRLVKSIAENKDSEYTGKGSDRVSLYNTTSLDSVISSDGSDMSLGSIIPDSKSNEAIDSFFDKSSYASFRARLTGVKLSVFNILTLDYNSEFLAYCYKELGIQASDVTDVLNSSIEEDTMFFVELVRKFHNIEYAKYYAFIREISLALGLPYQWKLTESSPVVDLSDIQNVA